MTLTWNQVVSNVEATVKKLLRPWGVNREVVKTATNKVLLLLKRMGKDIRNIEVTSDPRRIVNMLAEVTTKTWNCGNIKVFEHHQFEINALYCSNGNDQMLFLAALDQNDTNKKKVVAIGLYT